MPAGQASLQSVGLALDDAFVALALDDAFVALAFSGFLVVTGVLLMRRAFRLRHQRHLMTETPTEDVESVTLGPSEVTGRAVPADAAFRAPFSEDDCLVATWTVERYHRDDDSEGWRRVASGVECVPFYVDDGTGRLLVEPDAHVVYEFQNAEPVLEVAAGKRPPPAVREFFQHRRFSPLDRLRSELSFPTDFSLDPRDQFSFGGGTRREGDRRYTQQLLRPGEDVYVFGTVQRREGAHSARNPENLVIRRVPKRDRDLEPLFLVADHPEATLTRQRRWALLWFPIGALLATAGVGGLVLVLGDLFGLRVRLL